MSRLRLIVFDVDGTLVDSQADILAAMAAAFAVPGRPAPARADILGVVGLSLGRAMARLAPGVDADTRDEMVAAYRDAYFGLRGKHGVARSSPLYPGVRETLETLSAWPDTLIGVATGKSRRGLDALLDGHGLRSFFVTTQVADDHPSKPHPSMLHAALAETGVDAADAVMVGDTTYDMDMARAAGVDAIGVCWGYHPASALSSARVVLDDLGQLPGALNGMWERRA